MNNGATDHPVFLAIEAGDLPGTIRRLGNTRCDEPRNAWNATPLIMAAWHGRLEIVQHLLAQGADIDAAYDAGNTALIVAAWHGHEAVVTYLLSKGADLHALDDAALGWACGFQQLATAELLVSHGANVNGHGAEGRTFLQEAVAGGHTTVAEFLRNHGASE